MIILGSISIYEAAKLLAEMLKTDDIPVLGWSISTVFSRIEQLTTIFHYKSFENIAFQPLIPSFLIKSKRLKRNIGRMHPTILIPKL